MNKIILSLCFVLIALMGIACVSACDVDNCDDDQGNDILYSEFVNNTPASVAVDFEQNTAEDCDDVDIDYNVPKLRNGTELPHCGGTDFFGDPIPVSICNFNNVTFVSLISGEQNDILGETYYFTYLQWLHRKYDSFGEYDWNFLDSHFGEYVEEALEEGYEPEGEELFGLYLLTVNGCILSYDKYQFD